MVTTLGPMPLTLSHPAAVLPLRRLGLPVTVMVVGSMVPDVPVFTGSDRGYDVTHSLLGVVTVDVVMALIAVAWWTFVMRDALVDAAPHAVRRRLPARARLTRREWLLSPVAAAFGALTHLVWDAFTHSGAWGWRHIAWLREDHAGWSGTMWAQQVSGVVGLMVVAAAALAHLRAARPVDPDRAPRVLPAAALPSAIGLAGVVGTVSAAGHAPSGLYSMAFFAVVDGLIALTAGLVVLTAAWHLRRRENVGGIGSGSPRADPIPPTS